MSDIYVYGFIGESYWDDGITAKQFAEALAACEGDVTVHINSGGGDVFAAHAMSECIRGYAKGSVTASIEGYAASAASYFALTASRVVMNPSALVMVHNPSSYTYGDAAALRAEAELLDKVRDTIVGAYSRKTGRERTEIEPLMDAETWFDAREALEFGLVDELTEDDPVEACVDRTTSRAFKHAPEAIASARPGRAGESRAIVAPSAAEPAPGAGEAGPGAGPRCVCVNGTFLYG